MNAMEILKNLMNDSRFVFREDENEAGVWYYPLYRDRGDAPFSSECVQGCWDAARNNENETMLDVFERDVLEAEWDTSHVMIDLKTAFQQAIGESVLNGISVEIPQNFDFVGWYNEHVYNRVTPSEWARDGYSVCVDMGETLASFVSKYPGIDLTRALESVYADAERDAGETVFYTGNVEQKDLWELSDMVSGGAGTVEFKNVRLGNDDLPLTVSAKIPVKEIQELTVEPYDRTATEATIYRN